MLVHNGITAGSYIKANSTKIYPSAILHLIRPMTKLCLSDLFSISLAEFYSSDKLKLFLYSIFNSVIFVTSILTLSKNRFLCFNKVETTQLVIETKECQIVHFLLKMAEVTKAVSQQLILAVVAVAVQSRYCPQIPRQYLCHLHQMGDMGG